MKIGFVGLGKMGLPMALRLEEAGYSVRAMVRTRRPEMEKLRGTLVQAPADVAAATDLVVLMLPGPAEISLVLRGENGLFRHLPGGATVLDSSTSLPSLTRDLQHEASSRGLHYVDAPVIGGPTVAAEGGLQFLVGATEEDFATVRPILEHLGKETIHMGGPGSGHAAKIVNNMVALTNMAVLGEGMALAASLGLDAEKMTQMLSKGFGSSYVAQRHMPKIIKGDFTPTFTLSMGLKDLALASDVAREDGYPLFLAGTAMELFQVGRTMELGGQNYTAVSRVFERFGKPLRSLKPEG